MTTAEISAYLFGVDYCRSQPVMRVPTFDLEGHDPDGMSDEAAAAMFKLGRETFWRWALRGAIDASNER